MAEELTFISGSKEEQYLSLLPQVRSLIEGEVDLVANLANVAAALKEAFDFFWVGFYLVKQDASGYLCRDESELSSHRSRNAHE